MGTGRWQGGATKGADVEVAGQDFIQQGSWLHRQDLESCGGSGEDVPAEAWRLDMRAKLGSVALRRAAGFSGRYFHPPTHPPIQHFRARLGLGVM